MNILEVRVIGTITKKEGTAKQISTRLIEKGYAKGITYPNIRRILEKLVKERIAECKWEEGAKIYKSDTRKLREILKSIVNKTKEIAAIAMLIDHIGLILNSTPMRLMGRVSFPVFAYQFGKSWKLTSDKEKLSQRLLLWGVISQIPYALMTDKNQINMILGFWAIAEILKIVNKSQPKYKLAALLLGAIGCEIAQIDYGWYGPIAVVLLMSKTNHPLWWFSWTLINFAYSAWCGSVIQIAAAIAPALIIEKEEKPPSTIEKKFYYYFYPLHLAVLAAIKSFIEIF
jgi:histone H3/H4